MSENLKTLEEFSLFIGSGFLFSAGVGFARRAAESVGERGLRVVGVGL